MKRRTFIATAASVSAAAYLHQKSAVANEKLVLTKGDVILFQGDSITDAGRNKQSPVANEGLGSGYPNLIAELLHKEFPDLELQIHNRGISGNKVPDLDKRWEEDCIQLQPKVLSILIGVNDIWHKLNGNYDGTADTYRDGLDALLRRTREALPELTLVICEPFVLLSGTVKTNESRWFPEFTRRRLYAKQAAEKANAIWVPFQTMFDDAVAAGTKPEALAGDGVHPTAAGHALMAQTWFKTVLS